MKKPDLPIIGMKLSEAASIIEEAGYTFRTMSRDGKSLVGTADFRTDRLNLTTVDGKITSYSVG